MANILDLAEEFIESKMCIARDSQRLINWGLSNKLVTAAPPSKGTNYNWELSRRLKRQEADKIRKQNRIKEILSK
jgi:hypothetical protein